MEKKAFNKIQHSFIINSINKVGIERIFLNIIKAICDKLTANRIFNMEKLKPFSVRSRTGQRYSLSPLLFNIVLEVLVIALRQGKEIKGI